jgi:hypothetical protein
MNMAEWEEKQKKDTQEMMDMGLDLEAMEAASDIFEDVISNPPNINMEASVTEKMAITRAYFEVIIQTAQNCLDTLPPE